MVYANKGKFGIYPNQVNSTVLNVYANQGNGDSSVFQVGVNLGDQTLFNVFDVWNNGTVTINKIKKSDIFIVKNFSDEYFKIDNDGKVTINANGYIDNLAIKHRQSGLDAFVVNRNGKLTIKAKGHDNHFMVEHENGTLLHGITKDGTVLIRTQNNQPPLVIKTTNNQNLLVLTNTGELQLNTYGSPRSITVKNTAGVKTLQLDDSGLLRAREIKVDEDNWPDYVFEKDYKIFTLEQVAKYILKHKHLPGVPSAQQINTEGLSLGKMQTIIMQKVEELTLYTIEQNIQIKHLEKSVSKLEKENQQLKANLQQMNDRLDKIEALLNAK